MSTTMSAGIFDTSAIRQSCWQTCDNDAGAYPMDVRDVPFYRDSDTRKSFYNMAIFFGCVDLCEDSYETKRIVLIVPIVIIGEIVYQMLLYMINQISDKVNLDNVL